MKRKILFAGLMVISLVGLMGCSQKPDAQQAADAFINAEFYLKDVDQYEKSFGKRITNSDKATIMEELAEQLAELGLAKADSKKAADAMFKALETKTNYQVKVLTEDRDKATIEAKITGLAMTKFEENLQRLSVAKLLELMSAAGIENVETEEDLTDLASQAELEKAKEIVKAFHENPQNVNELMIQAIEEMETADQAKTVTFTLETNPKQKKYWQVNEQQQVIDEMTAILITPY